MNKFFIHNDCHNVHWELVYDFNLEYSDLVCVECGKGIDKQIKFKMLFLEQCHCNKCGINTWELVYDNDTGFYSLECEECGQTNDMVQVTGPMIPECQCGECGKSLSNEII